MKDKWRADRGHDRRRQHRESGSPMRRALHHGVSLETQISGFAGRRQGQTLTGIVEGDETFILESFKASGRTCRESPAERWQIGQTRLSAEQIPVIVARDRQGATTDAVLPKLNRVSIAARWTAPSRPANEFCCDAEQRSLPSHGGLDPGARPANARQTKSKGAGFSHQQRQCLP